MAGNLDAVQINAPFGDGTNSSSVLLVAVTTSAGVATVPAGWAGKWVRLKPVGGNVWVMASSLSTAAVDKTVSATTAGARSSHAGYELLDGAAEDFYLHSTAVALCHQGSASCTLTVLLTNAPVDLAP